MNRGSLLEALLEFSQLGAELAKELFGRAELGPGCIHGVVRVGDAARPVFGSERFAIGRRWAVERQAVGLEFSLRKVGSVVSSFGSTKASGLGRSMTGRMDMP